MNQNQCVPNWDRNDVCPTIPLPPLLPPLITKPFTSQTQSTSILADHTISTLYRQDYEIAELAWENGHLTMHGLGLPRTSNKNDIESACGTLESIVNQATHKLHSPFAPLGECDNNEVLVPLYNPNTIHLSPTPTDHMSVTTDALVPNTSNLDVPASKHVEVCSTHLGSCSGMAPSVRGYSDWSVSVSTCQSDKWHNTCEPLRSMTNGGIDSSFGASMDTTTRTVTFDDRDYHDSGCHNIYKRERLDDEDNQKKETSSTKRSRKADVHNQSERKRRDKINQRMKTLQNLVPNSNKTDKASMLDEIITYVKQLQAQVQVFNTMRSSSMLMPLAIQQQQQQLLQMSMMASMGMGYGMGVNVDQLNPSLNTMGPSNISGIPNVFLNPSAHMNATTTTNGVDHVTPQPINMTLPDPLSMYLATQSHSTTMEAYNKIASIMCQQQPSLNRKSDDK